MTLSLALEPPFARLRIDRAAKRNAFTQEMWEALPGLVAEAVAAPNVRVVLLESATPGIFCAGADISELLDRSGDAEWRAANQAAINRAQYDLTRAALPTIAFVDARGRHEMAIARSTITWFTTRSAFVPSSRVTTTWTPSGMNSASIRSTSASTARLTRTALV